METINNFLRYFDKKNKLLSIIWKSIIILVWFIFCLNLGKFLAYIIWSIILHLNLLEPLETFFSWFLWI